MKAIFLGAALCALAFSGAAVAADMPDYVSKAVADPSRPKTDSARDPLRAPAETLAFAGVKPGMTVAELFPSGGYYTRMISDVVGPKGKIYGIENPNGTRARTPRWPPSRATPMSRSSL